MARTWSGFLPQNMAAKAEWALLEESQLYRARNELVSIDEGGIVRPSNLEEFLDEFQKSGRLD